MKKEEGEGIEFALIHLTMMLLWLYSVKFQVKL